MTREEAIKIIEVMDKRYMTLESDERDALNMAIQALQAQTDCNTCDKAVRDRVGVIGCAKFDSKPTVAIPHDGEYVRKKDVMGCIGQTSLHFELARKLRKLPTVIIPSAEPCEDAISRQAAIDAIKHAQLNFSIISTINFADYKKEVQEIVDNILSAQIKAINELPPAKPQEPKTGHWILTDDDFVYCSECEDSYYPRPIDASWYYCPHCGARMVEPQERSDKE